MMTELLQLYERVKLDIDIYQPFVWRRIHWIIDLDEQGKILGVSPAVSRNTDSKGHVKESLGKKYRCPATFFLKLKEGKGKKEGGTSPKIQKRQEVISAAGGGNIPPELLIGKSLQIFGAEPNITKDKKGNITGTEALIVSKRIPKSNHDAYVALHGRFLDSLSLSCLPSSIGFKSEWGALRAFFDSKPKIPFENFSEQDLPRLTKDQRFSFRVNGKLLIQQTDANHWWRKEDETNAASTPLPVSFGELMSEADPLQVHEFLKGAWGGYAQVPNTSRFYAAVLSSPQSRVTVRSWHTETLPQAVEHFRRWMKLTLLPDHFGIDIPASIVQLAEATIRKGRNSKPLPRTYSELFEAALFGRPLSSGVYAAALERQALELAKGCDKKTRKEFEERLRSRTALIMLYFELNKKGEQFTMHNHTCQEDPAYLCGRLLFVLSPLLLTTSLSSQSSLSFAVQAPRDTP